MSQPGEWIYDAAANAAALIIDATNASVEQVVIEREGGLVILDFDARGRMIGLEVTGAMSLLGNEHLQRSRKV